MTRQSALCVWPEGEFQSSQGEGYPYRGVVDEHRVVQFVLVDPTFQQPVADSEPKPLGGLYLHGNEGVRPTLPQPPSCVGVESQARE